MLVCERCGKELKNPFHPLHINSPRHQKSLLYQESDFEEISAAPKNILDSLITSNVEQLNFNFLSWEVFEKLSLRIVRLEQTIKHVKIYGRKGQKQYGIDIVAWDQNNDIHVYQCKRYENLTVNDIDSLINEFLGNKWENLAKSFTLITSSSLQSTDLIDRITYWKEKIKNSHDIFFEDWDCNELSAKLKVLPRIVNDFFGRLFVEYFNGPDALEGVSQQLDRNELVKLRNKLREFYSTIFSDHDITSRLFNFEEVGLKDYFVVPSIEYQVRNLDPIVKEKEKKKALDNHQSILHSSKKIESYEKKHELITSTLSDAIFSKTNLLDWIRENKYNIIIGPSGSGKSTILRYLSLLILDHEDPITLSYDSKEIYIPLLIPFRYWINEIQKQNTVVSFSQIVENWFRSWDQTEILDLISHMLNEERLIVLIDGFDEHYDHSLAELANQTFKNFIKTNNVPAIITCRPNIIQKFHFPVKTWNYSEIKPFEKNKQKALIGNILNIINRQENSEIDVDRKIHSFNNYAAQIEKASTIIQTPIFLLFLIFLFLKDETKPKNKFDLINTIVRYFLTDYQQIRISASRSIIQREYTTDEIYVVLSTLAYGIKQSYSDGSELQKNDAISLLRELFISSKGIFESGIREANNNASAFFDRHYQTYGLVSVSNNGQIQFIHDIFLDYFVGYHLSDCDNELQFQILTRFYTEFKWTFSLQFLFYFNDNILENGELYSKFLESNIEKIEEEKMIYLSQIRFESDILFNGFQLPIDLKIKRVKKFSYIIENFNINHLSIYILKNYIQGLFDPDLTIEIQTNLKKWFPRPDYPLVNIFYNLKTWNYEDRIFDLLVKGILQEDFIGKIDAINTLNHFKENITDIKGKILNILESLPLDEMTSALLLNFLRVNWCEDKETENLFNKTVNSPYSYLNLIAICRRVDLDTQTEEDKDLLINYFGNERNFHDNFWKQVIVDSIGRGWPRDDQVRENCLNAFQPIHGHNRFDHFDRSMSYEILVKNYSEHDEVIKFIKNELASKTPFILNKQSWGFLREISDEVKSVIKDDIDNYLLRSKNINFFPNEFISSVLVCKTDVGKRKLINSLSGRMTHIIAEALLNNWNDDQEVHTELLKWVHGSDYQRASIAYVIPKLQKKKEAYDNLLSLLKLEKPPKPNFILHGLLELERDIINEDEIVALSIDIIKKHHSFIDQYRRNDMIRLLYLNFGENEKVKQLISEEFPKNETILSSLIYKETNNDEVFEIMRQKLTYLNEKLRLILVKELSNISSNGYDDFLISLFQSYEDERNYEIKTLSSIFFHKLFFDRFSNGDVKILEQVNKLLHDIQLIGLENIEGTRPAAFSGLIELDSIEKIADLQIPNGDLVKIPLFNFVNLNHSFVEYVSSKWKVLKSKLKLPAQYLDFLNYGEMYIWDTLSPYADQNPELLIDILEYFNNRTANEYVFVNILLLLKRKGYLNQPSKIMSIVKNNILSINPNKRIGDILLLCSKLDIDLEIEKDFIYSSPGKINIENIPFLVHYYSSFDSSNPLLKEIWDFVKKSHSPLTFPVYYELMGLFSSDREIIEFIKNINPLKLRYNVNQALINPIINRIIRNRKLFNFLLKILNVTNDIFLKSIIVQILYQINNEKIINWILEEIKRVDFLQFGYDLKQDRMTSYFEILYDLTTTI